MNDNGLFRRKNGFTIAGNTLTRDKRLSLKAKGLYLLIMSYITFEDITLTKSFLLYMCTEKEKAFESIWNELKEKGYLKVYLRPSSKGWQVEYELLVEPKEGAHTFYLTTNGDISCTNLDRENNRKAKENQHIPQKGSNAERRHAKGCNAKGENNIRPLDNTKDKTIDNNLSFIQKEGMIKIDLFETVQNELEKHDGIPYEYCLDIEKATTAVRYITHWSRYYPNGYKDEFFQQTFNLAVEALIEMICEKEVRIYNKRKVTYANVIDKINESMRGQPGRSIHALVEGAVEDYINAASKEEIKYPRNYIKSCIMERFDTHHVKFGSLFNRTYYNRDYSGTVS